MFAQVDGAAVERFNQNMSLHRPSKCQGPINTFTSTAAISNTSHALQGLGLNVEGRIQYQRREVSCHLNQGRHALLQQEGPDISHLEPALQQQWDHAANAHLGNIVIKPYSKKKVQWICDRCPDGHLHSWSARLDSRTRGSGCPQCIGRKVCKHNSLATLAPLIAAQWDYAANHGTPEELVAESKQSVAWLCAACGYKWNVAPSVRVRKQSGCPQCADRSTKIRHPTFAESQDPLLAEWDHERNESEENFPDNTRLQSRKQIFWLCTKCPEGLKHSWSARPSHRTSRQSSGCPFCAGQAVCQCNSLQTLHPDIAAEWDYARNKGQPSEYTACSIHLAWWSNSQRGSWQQTVKSRSNAVHHRIARLKHVQQRQNRKTHS